jgi:hypothetical protein
VRQNAQETNDGSGNGVFEPDLGAVFLFCHRLSLFRCEVILAGLVVKTGTSNAAKPKYTLREN